jgi:hypothetical protein
MTVVEFPDRLVDRIKSIARAENRPVADVLDDMLRQYQSPTMPETYSTWPLQMALMAEADSDQIEWTAVAPDLSTRSRDILESEFAEELMKRLQHGE